MTLDAAAAPNPPQPPASSGKTPGRREGTYRDTVESILIAFILAFIFRAFVVEAFVIPTGSMAPTLLGAHTHFTCERCGYQFEANFSQGGGDDNVPAEVAHKDFSHTDCPNCSYTVHDPRDVKGGSRVPIHYGDRILVLKYAYLLQEPSRWDVVVFKSPDDPYPGTSWYVTNFIKRLVGKPGESLMVMDGDVYVSTDPNAAPEDLSSFKVQTKPRDVQDALWRIVYDNDFLPVGKTQREDDSWEQPWKVESGTGWNVGTEQQPSRVFSFNSSETGVIRFDIDANKGRALTDWLPYAQNESGRNNVSDVKLGFLYHRKAGDGKLVAQLSKQDNSFAAELSRGRARLIGNGAEIGSAEVAELKGEGPVTVDFINVDYTLTIRVAGRDVIKASYHPDLKRLQSFFLRGAQPPKPEITITAENQTAALSHISLWRDVYYTNSGQGGIVRAAPNTPVHLGKDEFFVLGDNTVISKDARYWDKPIDLPAENLSIEAGRVPKRFMLGKAFFVYWPAGFRPFGSSALPGFIPNFGDMRSIH